MAFNSGDSSKKGSVTIIVVCLFTTIILMLAVLLQSNTQRRFTVKRVYESHKARMAAQTLANLYLHMLRDPNLERSKDFWVAIKQPFSQLKDTEGEQVNFTEADVFDGYEPFKRIMIELLHQINNDLPEFDFHVKWKLLKSDFEGLLEEYPNEKKGKVRISVYVQYYPPGTRGELIKEEFVFSSNVKVVTNTLPVLSKFTLYIEEAVSSDSDEEKNRFNILQTDYSGNPINDAKPWVLHNGIEDVANFDYTYSNIVESKVGLVYLGSKPDNASINLGLSRSWGTPGKYSEGIHFFKLDSGSEGFVAQTQVDDLYVLAWEVGLSAETESDFYYLVNNCNKNEDIIKNSSVLKLYGVGGEGGRYSPTLVLGNVRARSQVARGFKNVDATKAGYLPVFADDGESFKLAIQQETEKNDDKFSTIFYFAEAYKKDNNGKELEYEEYTFGKRHFCSEIWDLPYNKGLLYCSTHNKDEHPEETSPIKDDTIAKEYIFYEKEPDFAKIPDKFDAFGVKTLKEMDKLLDLKQLMLNGDVDDDADEKEKDENFARLAYNIKAEGENDLATLLKSKGLLVEKDGSKCLQCEGWVYINTNNGLTIDNIQYSKNCGIIVKKGDVTINGDISRAKKTTEVDSNKVEPYILNIVANDGDIIVNGSNIEAALTSRKEIKIVGGGSSPAKITGNMAMKSIRNLGNSMQRELRLSYYPEMSIMPKKEDETNCLMVTIDDKLDFVDRVGGM